MRSERIDAFVSQVRSQTDILRVVQSYVPLKRRGNRYWGCCPFHGEKTPSFSVVPEKGFFYCFGCHAGGNVFKFLSMIENVSYFDAIKMQAEKLGIPIPSRQQSPEEQKREQEKQDLLKVNTMARDFFHNCLQKTKLGEPGKRYFAGRGISDKTIEAFQLGYAPDSWDKLSAAFLKRGVKQEYLLASGLVSQRKSGNGVYDRFRGRVIIPITDVRGRVVGFGGRVLDDSTPKYLNTPETMLFNKRRLLFGLDRAHRAIQQAGYAIVVEGYMDAISVFDAGVENVVASLGTAFTIQHAKLIQRYAEEIYFCYDSDEAGQKATMRALSIVKETGIRVKVIIVPDGKDPDEFIRKHGADAFRALTQKALPLVEYHLQYVLKHNRYDTMDGKASVIRAMLPVLASIRNDAVRNEYKKKLAQILLVDEGIITHDLRHYRPEAEIVPTEAPKAVQRQAVQRADNAQVRAGRIVLRLVWQDLSLLAHVKTFVPLGKITDPVQREIFLYLDGLLAQGEAPDDVKAAAQLSEEAYAELSHALVENFGGREEMAAYTDSLGVLRKAYLSAAILEHAQKAEAAQQSGRDADALAELRLMNDLIKQKNAVGLQE